jgi:hypothetical protein
MVDLLLIQGCRFYNLKKLKEKKAGKILSKENYKEYTRIISVKIK